MYIVIVGCGKIGSIVAKELANQNHHISVVERAGDKLASLGQGFNGFITKGIEFDHDNLVGAGIERADVLLALTDDDNINITVALVATKIFGVKRVIAQVIDPIRRPVYDALNIEVISPVRMGVNALLGKMSLTTAEKLMQLAQDHEIIRVVNHRTDTFTVEDLEAEIGGVVSAIERDHDVIIPFLKNSKIKQGDGLVVTLHVGDRHKLGEFVKE
ncbi:MAG: TrkA family potassium uptake protein [Erysipelotrichaceae bacterium]